MPYTPDSYFAPSKVGRIFFWVFAALPWCPLAKATRDLAAATNSERDPGLRWSQRSSYCQYIPDAVAQPPYDPTQTYVSYSCIFPPEQCFVTLAVQAAAWLALAVYLDALWSGGAQARPPWFFLLPSYWWRARSAERGLSRHAEGLLPAGAQGRHIAGGSAAGGPGSGPSAQSQQVKQPAGLQAGGLWGLSQGQRPGSQAASGAAPGSNEASAVVTLGASGIDEDVAAEEARMQGVLAALLAAPGKAAPAAAAPGAGLEPVLSYQQSWPRLLSTVPQQLQRGPSGLAVASAAPQPEQAAAGNEAADAHCQVLDGQQQQQHGGQRWTTAGGFSVAMFGLAKTFRAGAVGRCLGTARDFHALRSTWLGIPPGQLLALLGPNGAGKTTTIACLTGLLAPSAGEVLVCGESILREGGLDRARRLIGVCPQFDVLWGELTGLEHLLLAGHVKGLPWGEVAASARQLLACVQLTDAANLRSSAYSGGMRRRLSVALALVGDPKILFLDEPTTGMDPISRRAVWDVIQAAKPGRAIVLTTHSMEEADVLGDRVAVMARGRLRTLGSSIRLKQKWGAGYQVVVTLQDPTSSGLRQRKTRPASQQGQQQQQHEGSQAPATLSTCGVVLGQQQRASAPLHVAESGGSAAEHGSGAPRHPASAASAAAAAAAVADHKAAVRQLFAEHLAGLQVEEGKRSLKFLVPRAQQAQLVALLQQLEAAMAGSSSSSSSGGGGGIGQDLAARLRQGVADVQLSLSSLEEVFLSIAKQAELEASAETGATVSITLPDTGRQLQVPVGTEWVTQDEAERPSRGQPAQPGSPGWQPSGSARAARTYHVQWVQDETGALAVLVVVPVSASTAGSSSSSSSRGGAAGSGAVAPVAT